MHEKAEKILFSCMESNISMHENEIFMRDHDISMNDFFAPEIYMDIWAVHNFMHGVI